MVTGENVEIIRIIFTNSGWQSLKTSQDNSIQDILVCNGCLQVFTLAHVWNYARKQTALACSDVTRSKSHTETATCFHAVTHSLREISEQNEKHCVTNHVILPKRNNAHKGLRLIYCVSQSNKSSWWASIVRHFRT
jgi:hypothetical protein